MAGFTVTFTGDNNYGSIANPLTGNINSAPSFGVLDACVLLTHNDSVAPTFDASFKKLSGSGTYVTGQVNYIMCLYINANEILYSISQRS